MRWRRLGIRLAVLLFASVVVVLILGAMPADAHPLGNFTVNQYSGLQVRTDGVTVHYVLDMAELPAYQERTTAVDADHDGAVSAAETSAYEAAKCATLAHGFTLRVGGRALTLRAARGALSAPPGAGGLATLRLECTMRADVRFGGERSIDYRADAYGDRVGWREITAVGDGVTLVGSGVPAKSISNALTRYPEDLLASPPNARQVDLRVRPGGPRAEAASAVGALPAATRGVDALTRWFTDFVGRPRLTVTLGVLALLVSIVLGAVHALAPGHGKTVMAAFLVGERGSARQAGLIAMTVTFTHTAGVLVLGVALTMSVVLAPQRIYGWLGLVSGIMLAAVGASLLRRAWRTRHGGEWLGHEHSHGPGHEHSHGPGHEHSHGPGHEHGHSPDHAHGRGAADQMHADGRAHHAHAHGTPGQPHTDDTPGVHYEVLDPRSSSAGRMHADGVGRARDVDADDLAPPAERHTHDAEPTSPRGELPGNAAPHGRSSHPDVELADGALYWAPTSADTVRSWPNAGQPRDFAVVEHLPRAGGERDEALTEPHEGVDGASGGRRTGRPHAVGPVSHSHRAPAPGGVRGWVRNVWTHLHRPGVEGMMPKQSVAPGDSTPVIVSGSVPARSASDHLEHAWGDGPRRGGPAVPAHNRGDVRPRQGDRTRQHEADYLRARLHGYEQATRRPAATVRALPPDGEDRAGTWGARRKSGARRAASATASGRLGLRSLIAMGFAGGLVPSPSALVVLLGAVALGRTWFGVLLVVGYGAGMACTLTGVGFALARWRSMFDRRLAGRAGTMLRRFMPLVTAGLIVVVGTGVAAQAAVLLGS